jgi:outer membrane protein
MARRDEESRMTHRTGAGIGLAMAGLLAASQAVAQTGPRAGDQPTLPAVHTLQEALALAYTYNTTLTAARAGLRATDENVPAALAGWHPTLVFAGVAGYATGHTNPVPGATVAGGDGSFPNPVAGAREERREYQATLTLTQSIYRGGRTKAQTNQAINRVYAARAALLATEEQVLAQTVSAFVGVISSEQVLELDRSDEQVLTKQLQATNDRFTVGEITRTDVAQAEAALAQATATRQTAEGQLQTARATFQQVVGVLPGKLVEPQPLKLPTRTEEQARLLAARNNPNVVSALFTDAEAKDTFDLAYSQLMPNVNVQGSAFYIHDVQQPFLRSQGGSVLANVTIPIYQGGSEYAAIRQARQQEQQTARQVDDARRTAVQQAVSAWETYVASKATIASDQAAIKANEIALEGIEREALVGSRTTLDVLNAQETLLQSRVALVQTLTNFITASYTVAQAVGRLTARDLSLPVELYDDTAYYNAVKNLWIGSGDFATNQPGR